MRKSRKMQRLIERMAKQRGVNLNQPGEHFKVSSPGFMDLSVECIGINQVAVTHYYEQNGDLCQDPEIVFLVGCDGEWYPTEWTTPLVSMGSYTMGGWRCCAKVDAENGTWTWANLGEQRDLAIFANKWAHNLRMQGFK